MKWYAYKKEKNQLTMILDHNTTTTVAYNSSGSNTSPKEVAEALKEDTENWKTTARLITGQEVADIVGNTVWTASLDDIVYFQETSGKGNSKFSWLFDYTYKCEQYGCDNEDYYTFGYWTSTPEVSEWNDFHVWYVDRKGVLGSPTGITVDEDDKLGVRPVITITK